MRDYRQVGVRHSIAKMSFNTAILRELVKVLHDAEEIDEQKLAVAVRKCISNLKSIKADLSTLRSKLVNVVE